MLVSKKLPGIRLVAIELEVGGKAAAERTKALQHLLPSGLALDGELPRIGDVEFDLVAVFQLQRLDHRSREANGKAVAPFGDPHDKLRSVDSTQFDIRAKNCISSRGRDQEQNADSTTR